MDIPVRVVTEQGYPLWFKNSKNQDDVNCHHILLLFDTVVELEEDMRLDKKICMQWNYINLYREFVTGLTRKVLGI